VPRLHPAGWHGHEAIPSLQLWISPESLHMFLSFRCSRSLKGRIRRSAKASMWSLFGPYLTNTINNPPPTSPSSISMHADALVVFTKLLENTMRPSLPENFSGCSYPTWDELRCVEWITSNVGGEGDAGDQARPMGTGNRVRCYV